MKIVRMEQDKIKVILSENDLIDMNINVEKLTPNSPELSVVLKNIIDTVRLETGFSAENGQVMVEASTYENGIVLTLSKKNDKSRIKSVKISKKKGRAVFEFESFDELLQMLLNVEKRYISAMKLYRCFDKFYITLPKNNIPFVIYEFSLRNRKSSIAESKLFEYGKLLAEGKKIDGMISYLKN